MKTYKQLIQDLLEAWPGTPEYKKRFGDNNTTGAGSRHNISSSGGVTRATRRYDQDTGESEEPTKSREDAKEAPAKRGRGRPPGQYGKYKKKVKESLDIIESLETEEEINQFIDSLDEESYLAIEEFLVEKELSPKQKKIDHNKNDKIDGYDLAMLRSKKKNEEVEQVDELSKSTLRSYIDKKSDDHESNRNAVADARDALRKHQKNKPSLDAPLKHQFDHSEKKRELEKDVNAASRTATRSNVNILKAKKRLNKEEVEQIDELSNDTHTEK